MTKKLGKSSVFRGREAEKVVSSESDNQEMNASFGKKKGNRRRKKFADRKGSAGTGRALAKTDEAVRVPARRLDVYLGGHEAAEHSGQAKPRHRFLLASFVFLVVLPFMVSTWYLFERSADQYHSIVAFSVRSEDSSPTIEMFGALAGSSSIVSSDAEILFSFISSQQMVEQLEKELDLRQLYNSPSADPVFRLGDNRSIEYLNLYWKWMTDVSLDSNTGLIEVKAIAFSPEAAQGIAAGILRQSSAMINRLSEAAREDAIRYARADLADAERRLRDERLKLRKFRSEYRLVDPEAEVAGQMGLLLALEQKLAEEMISRNSLMSFARADNPRLENSNRRIEAIQLQIKEEKEKLAADSATSSGEPLAEVIGLYEELQVNLQFAENTYTAALAGYDQARIDARRQSRYLADHISPTLSEKAQYPRRFALTAMIGGFLFLIWGTIALLAYNIRDRK